MSVANEANNKLQQLVNLTTEIKKHLVGGDDSKKGQKNEKSTTTETSKGSLVDSTKEAMAIGGMATSIAKLIVATNVLSSKAGTKVKDFLVSFTEGVVEASKNLDQVNGGKEVIESLATLSKSLMSFALGMAAIGLLSPLVALGTIVFKLAISAIIQSLNKATAAAGKGAAALETLMGIGKGIALFALTMVGIALVAPLFALGALAFILAIKGILWALNSADKNAGKGASALNTLMKIGKYIAIFALTMVAIGLTAPLFALGVLVFVLSIKAIMMVLNALGKDSVQINKGTRALNSMIKPILFFGLVMGLAGLAAQYIAIGALVLGLSIGFIGFAAYTLGKYDKGGQVSKGALILDQLILPMIGFAIGLAIIGATVGNPVDLALKVAVIGGAILILGLAASILGQPEIAVFAEIGAGVLISLAASLVVFAAALWILSKADFTREKTENLGYAIFEIGWAMQKLAVAAPLALVGAAIILPASAALIILTGALAIFKTIDWQESDGVALQSALTSTVQGFSHALDGLGVAGIVKAMAAIPMIALMGLALVSLAAGVKAMATLSFTEMEYDKASKKLVAKRVVKLTDAEIQQVGPNVAAILNALAMPLTSFGMWSTMGETGFGPFTIGAGYMQKGIRAAGEIGNVISSLAKGVADMANLNVVDYEVRNGKLVPKSVRKLTPGDFILAGINTGFILETLMIPLSNFGKESAKGEGKYWGDGYVVKGIEAAAKVGNAIASIAKGVSDMATLNVVEYAVKNNKLVPVSTRKLTPDDFTAAATNVDSILTALTKPLTDFGRNYKNGSSWFTDSALEAGITATGKIVDPISKMADMVLKLASGQATINEVINPGTKDAKLVAKGTISFADAIPTAIKNAKKLLYAFPQIFANLGIYLDKWEDEIDTAIEFMPRMSSAMEDVLDVSKSYLGITKNIAESSKDGKNIDGVLTGFASSLATMGKSFDKMDNNKITLYKKFASITEGMTKINTPFEKFTKTFGQFTKDMGAFVKVWDAFGKDDATNLKTYADSLKTIASVDAGKLSATTKALKEQAQAQAALNNVQKSSAAAPAAKEEKGIVSKITDKAKEVFSSGSSQQQAPPPAAQQGGLGGGGGVIARLEVTNLYINGKLQR